MNTKRGIDSGLIGLGFQSQGAHSKTLLSFVKDNANATITSGADVCLDHGAQKRIVVFTEIFDKAIQLLSDPKEMEFYIGKDFDKRHICGFLCTIRNQGIDLDQGRKLVCEIFPMSAAGNSIFAIKELTEFLESVFFLRILLLGENIHLSKDEIVSFIFEDLCGAYGLSLQQGVNSMLKLLEDGKDLDQIRSVLKLDEKIRDNMDTYSNIQKRSKRYIEIITFFKERNEHKVADLLLTAIDTNQGFRSRVTAIKELGKYLEEDYILEVFQNMIEDSKEYLPIHEALFSTLSTKKSSGKIGAVLIGYRNYPFYDQRVLEMAIQSSDETGVNHSNNIPQTIPDLLSMLSTHRSVGVTLKINDAVSSLARNNILGENDIITREVLEKIRQELIKQKSSLSQEDIFLTLFSGMQSGVEAKSPIEEARDFIEDLQKHFF